MTQGFDSWFGLPYSHDMRMVTPNTQGAQNPKLYDPKPEDWDVPLMRNGEEIERPVNHRTLTARYTDEAVRFIGANRAKPFFLYLAHSLPHVPLARSAPFVGHSAGGIYGDVIEEIDASTGRILDALTKAGLIADPGRLHQRQRAVAAVRRPCRVGRPSPTARARRGRAASGRPRSSGGPAR